MILEGADGGIGLDDVDFIDNGDGSWTAKFPAGAGSVTFDETVVTQIDLSDGLGGVNASMLYDSAQGAYEVFDQDNNLLFLM